MLCKKLTGDHEPEALGVAVLARHLGLAPDALRGLGVAVADQGHVDVVRQHAVRLVQIVRDELLAAASVGLEVELDRDGAIGLGDRLVLAGAHDGSAGGVGVATGLGAECADREGQEQDGTHLKWRRVPVTSETFTLLWLLRGLATLA